MLRTAIDGYFAARVRRGGYVMMQRRGGIGFVLISGSVLTLVLGLWGAVHYWILPVREQALRQRSYEALTNLQVGSRVEAIRDALGRTRQLHERRSTRSGSVASRYWNAFRTPRPIAPTAADHSLARPRPATTSNSTSLLDHQTSTSHAGRNPRGNLGAARST